MFLIVLQFSASNEYNYGEWTFFTTNRIWNWLKFATRLVYVKAFCSVIARDQDLNRLLQKAFKRFQDSKFVEFNFFLLFDA